MPKLAERDVILMSFLADLLKPLDSLKGCVQWGIPWWFLAIHFTGVWQRFVLFYIWFVFISGYVLAYNFLSDLLHGKKMPWINHTVNGRIWLWRRNHVVSVGISRLRLHYISCICFFLHTQPGGTCQCYVAIRQFVCVQCAWCWVCWTR